MEDPEMARISDDCVTVFSDAYKTAMDNFTDEDLSRIREVASELKRILDDAKRRQQEKLSKRAGL